LGKNAKPIDGHLRTQLMTDETWKCGCDIYWNCIEKY